MTFRHTHACIKDLTPHLIHSKRPYSLTYNNLQTQTHGNLRSQQHNIPRHDAHKHKLSAQTGQAIRVQHRLARNIHASTSIFFVKHALRITSHRLADKLYPDLCCSSQTYVRIDSCQENSAYGMRFVLIGSTENSFDKTCFTHSHTAFRAC